MRVLNIITLLAALTFIAGPVAAAEKDKAHHEMAGKGKAQALCPVSGKAINKEYYADYSGKRVYFCCPNCAADFKKDPEAMLKKMEAEGIMLASTPMHEAMAQTVCPVSGKAINKEYYADYNGKRVYFCCPNCPADFKKDPEAMLKKMEAAGIMLASTPKHEAMAQTVCPMSGKPIDKEIYTDYKGKRIYFCSQDCLDEFKKDPEATCKKMESEGVKPEDAPGKM